MLQDLFGLAGKVSLVTGAGRGLGREAALALAAAGSDVALVGRTPSELDSAARAIEALGRRALVLVADLADFEHAPSLVERTVADLGRIDVLLNNASVIARETVAETSWDNYDWQMNVNLKATIALSRAAVPHMAQVGGGKIISVTSLAAMLGTGHYSAYCVSKAGVSLFSKSLAIELARDGIDIQVNCIGPGMFATEMNRTANEIDPAFEQFVLSKIPMKRPADPEEIRGLVLFLAGKASSYVTGQDIYIDGGWLANGA